MIHVLCAPLVTGACPQNRNPSLNLRPLASRPAVGDRLINLSSAASSGSGPRSACTPTAPSVTTAEKTKASQHGAPRPFPTNCARGPSHTRSRSPQRHPRHPPPPHPPPPPTERPRAPQPHQEPLTTTASPKPLSYERPPPAHLACGRHGEEE